MKKKLLLYLMMVLPGAGCQHHGGTATSDGVEIIDFTSFSETEVEQFPDAIVRERTYINIDASNEELLFKAIDKIKIINDRIYIMGRQDVRTEKLFVFDRTGAGVGVVGQRGQGPEDYLQISDFDVNERDDIFFMDGTFNNDRVFVFDKNLQFVSVRKLPFEADILKCLPGDRLLFGLASWNRGQNASMKLAVTDRDLNTEQAYMEYDEYIDEVIWVSYYFFIDVDGRIQYNRQIDNNVHEISPEGNLTKTYRIDFGKKNLPDIYKKDIEANREEMKRYCYLLNFAAITDRYILGTLSDRGRIKAYIADRNSRKLYTMGMPDKISDMSLYADNLFITYLYPGKYEDLESKNLPPEVKKHIEDENFTICLNHLK
ncbi:MAG: 6-bladed beta-propeller [Prevotellaceae bacterium]|jgi:hypothetical protein|nr:6-bladed beta-propeller [Prevotellaceae bacterium]